tara:strand:- start:76 stop:279 length:204 start_codon:yes stop_codon:yes gene_type:complete
MDNISSSSNNVDADKKQVNIEDMTPQQNLEALWSLLNKAANKGVYNIDESYVIKVIFSKLTKELSEK